MRELVVIGITPEESEQVAAYLLDGQDVCFGRFFAKTLPECINCKMPVVFNGKIALLKEVCAAKFAGKQTTIELKNLNSQQVLERLERKVPLAAIFKEILGEAPAALMSAKARELIVTRLAYLATMGYEVPVVPRTKQLLREMQEDSL